MTQIDSEAAIFTAIRTNNLEEATELLLQQESVQALDTLGRSPLMVAVQGNNLTMVVLCLEAGLDLNQKDSTELSPFIAAAANGFDEVFQLLLTEAPELASVNRFGGTALLPSSEKGYLKTVQLAIAAGVPVNHINRLGWSALLEAVILGDGGYLYQEVIRELVEAQADIYQIDFEHKHSVDYAIQSGQSDVQAILEQTFIDDYEKIRTFIRQNQLFLALKEAMNHSDEPKKFFYLGYIFEQLKKYDVSRYYYQQGLKKDGQFAFYLANLERKLGDQNKAFAYFDLGIEQTNTSFFRYHKSNYLRELGNHSAAVKEMDYLLKEEPKRVDFMFHKANSLRSLGENHQAIDSLELAAHIIPENPLFAEQANKVKKMRDKGE